MSSDADAIIPLYQRHAAAWVAARLREGTLYERAWLERFRALMPADGSVLDLGCGAGAPIATWFVAQGHEVTGVDSAPAMIAMFNARLPGQPSHVADMRRLSLGRRFAGLLAWDSFFHLSPDDQAAMFPVFRDHAAPGAPLMFTSGPAAGVAIGELEGEPLYHASLGPEDNRRLLAEHGFGVIAMKAEDPECGHRTVWLARAT